MPKRKRDSDEESSAVESNASSVEETKPKKKTTKASSSRGKAKVAVASTSAGTTEKDINGVKYKVSPEGESYIELGGKSRRRITVREFRGATLVDIREFYEDKGSGEWKPGKKGISLTFDEWRELVRVSDVVTTLAEGP